MATEIKFEDPSRTDQVKLGAAALIVVGGIAGYYLVGNQWWLRWACVVASLVVAAGVVAWSRYGADLRQFVLDSRTELRKIVWPTRNETGMTTLVVFAFVLVAGVFFWLLDVGLAWLTRHLTGQGG